MAVSRKIFAAALAAAVGALISAHPAYAAGTGSYAEWTTTGAGTPAAGFPVAHMTSTASSVLIPSGATAYLGPNTPPGQEYGSSQAMNYLSVSTAASGAPSVTTLTFDQPTPVGTWAFVLGDVDADLVKVEATGPNGPVTVADLGFVSAFNYCAFSPKPGSCSGSGSDVPTWIPDTATLTGNFIDTSGASGWFQPTVAITTLRLTFTRQIGFPTYQVWLAAKAVPVETVVTGAVGECEPRLELLDAQGRPVLDADGKPVVAKADEDGHARFAAVADGRYTIRLVAPACGEAQGPTDVPITVDTSTGQPVVLPAGTFSISVVLPDTGTPIAAVVSAGLGLVLLGLSLLRLGRLRWR